MNDNVGIGNKVALKFKMGDGHKVFDLWIEGVVVGFTGTGHPTVLYLDPIESEYQRKVCMKHEYRKIK